MSTFYNADVNHWLHFIKTNWTVVIYAHTVSRDLADTFKFLKRVAQIFAWHIKFQDTLLTIAWALFRFFIKKDIHFFDTINKISLFHLKHVLFYSVYKYYIIFIFKHLFYSNVITHNKFHTDSADSTENCPLFMYTGKWS